jgi:hypothetical protein
MLWITTPNWRDKTAKACVIIGVMAMVAGFMIMLFHNLEWGIGIMVSGFIVLAISRNF